jgi:SAM-dependent methyltransferase
MASYEPFDWYAEPLYYDVIFDTDTPQEARFLQALHERHGRSAGRRVLEPACGSGRLLAALAARGYAVNGFDLSPAMVRFARERLRDRGLSGGVRVDRMGSFQYRRRFDLAHCLVSTFKYLLDDESAVAHLRRVAEVLRPGGVYVLGVHLTDYRNREGDRERWRGRRGDLAVTCTIDSDAPDPRRRRERVRARIVAREGGTVRRLETRWAFRTYGPRQLRAVLRQVPALRHVATYGFDCDPQAPVAFGGGRLDPVLVLRKAPETAEAPREAADKARAAGAKRKRALGRGGRRP